MAEKIHDIFGPGSNFKGRVVKDYDTLIELVTAAKKLGLKIVLTSGTFDLFHIGHSRYLEAAKACGDLLIVGVDNDIKVKNKKGKHRPIVSEKERMEILCHCRHVDLVFLKQVDDEKWKLIKTVKPDVLIATKRVYQNGDLVDLEKCCREIKLLESQATTSTTAKIRLVLIDPVEKIKQRLGETVKEVNRFLDQLTGGDL